MQPGGGGGGERGCTAQDHQPATDHRDEDAASHSTPPLSFIVPVASEEKKQKREEEEQQQPAASLPEGPLVEILARVPYRSLCRFKCVSKPWLALCSSRDIIKRSPRTLSGFFHYQHSTFRFHNLLGRGSPLVSISFLRESYKNIFVQQFCGGLLLCKCWNPDTESNYLVCNPVTEEWTVLPPIARPDDKFYFIQITCLGFDAAVPSRFVVFVPLTDGQDVCEKVAIYSSESGQWTYVQCKWDPRTPVEYYSRTNVYVNGIMHWTTLRKSIVTVDTEGKVWREIKMPDDLPSHTDTVSIGQSQGRLYAWQIDNPRDCQLYIWVLEDYGTGKWTLKHSVNVLELFGRRPREDVLWYTMFSMHPDCNVIFIADLEKMTFSYNLDTRKLDVICSESMYGLPYIPCFAELPSVGH